MAQYFEQMKNLNFHGRQETVSQQTQNATIDNVEEVKRSKR